ncbi:MAG: NUDIX hydrolase [Thermoleophilaceae bacterium]|nr:NUDIX hydrolase [Thermoleophilaceae bacterium]
MTREFSAGGLVLRRRDGIVEAALIRTKRGATAIPKGHPDPGETAEEAALREVREESGLVAETIEPLGEVKYVYQRGGIPRPKTVAFYLMRFLSGDVADHDDEVTEAFWIRLEDTVAKLTYEGERRIATTALTRVAEADFDL